MTASRLGILASGFLLIAIAASALRADTVLPSSEIAEPDLIAVRKATERFRDVKVALAEGFIRDPFDLCDTAEMMDDLPRWAPWASTSSGPTCSASPRRRIRA